MSLRHFNPNLRRIGVFLPGNYQLASGMARTAALLCNALLRTDSCREVIFGINVDPEHIRPLIEPDHFDRLKVRRLIWMQGFDSHDTCWIRPVTEDGYDFLDCESWIFCSAPTAGVIAPLRPFAIFCADLLSRIVPRSYDFGGQDSPSWFAFLNCLRSFRVANLVFTTTDRTLDDVISYAGVPRSRTAQAPQFSFSENEVEPAGRNPSPFGKYLLWTSNDSFHKNHLRAFEMLARYYAKCPEEALPVIITGAGTQYFNPLEKPSGHPYHLQVRAIVQAQPILMKNVFFAGSLRRADYLAVLKDAAFLWHNVIYDNGTASVFEAAEFGVPSLVSDYPQMRFFDDRYKTNATFFSAFDIEGGTSALLEMTRKVNQKIVLPTKLDYKLDYERFSTWADSLAGFLRSQTANKVARLADADALFHSSSSSRLLRENAKDLWAGSDIYLKNFPWSDTVVAGIVINDAHSAPMLEAIELFTEALRASYIDFKLLILAPKAIWNVLAKKILGDVLAFDFILAGDPTSDADQAAVIRLAQVIFVAGAAQPSAAGRNLCKQKGISIFLLQDCVADKQALINSVLTSLRPELKMPLQTALGGKVDSNDLVDAESFTLSAKDISLDSVIDFTKSDHTQSILLGFYGWERGFRWVGPSAGILLGSPAGATADLDSEANMQNARMMVSESVLNVELRFEAHHLPSGHASPEIKVFFNETFLGAFPLTTGYSNLSIAVPNGSIGQSGVNYIRFEANVAYKAGGSSSPDQRQISWQALAISLFSKIPSHSKRRSLFDRLRLSFGRAGKLFSRKKCF